MLVGVESRDGPRISFIFYLILNIFDSNHLSVKFEKIYFCYIPCHKYTSKINYNGTLRDQKNGENHFQLESYIFFSFYFSIFRPALKGNKAISYISMWFPLERAPFFPEKKMASRSLLHLVSCFIQHT